ncbi:MAG TPA: TetR/AcrR family transcriptional regulator [Hyphomonadaceae bacterium]|nr:TetR/AcrR family transcriptional regulator [Hyphomonadaceae bacterium]
MTTASLSVAKPKRRTNPERSAETRQQVMDAVIAILNANGFSALTNALITADTGISTGALMHHFPTRQKLLIATVEYAYSTIADYRRQQFGSLEPGLPRFRALIDMSWHTARMPAGFAVNEVRIGARSDDQLAAMFRPVFTRIAQEYGRFVSKLVREAGLEPNEEMRGLWIATSMAMRSMAIDRKTYGGADISASTLLALRTLRENLIVTQLGEAAGQDPHIAWQPASLSTAKRRRG